jgi:hypothetical protein
LHVIDRLAVCPRSKIVEVGAVITADTGPGDTVSAEVPIFVTALLITVAVKVPLPAVEK